MPEETVIAGQPSELAAHQEPPAPRRPAAPLPLSWKEIGGLLLLVVYFLGLDAGLATFSQDMPAPGHWYRDLLVGVSIFTPACQFIFLLVWATLFPGSHPLRITSGALVGSLGAAWCMYWLGTASRPQDYALLFVPMLLLLPVFFIAQLPLWGLRWWFAWRVVLGGQPSQPVLGARKLTLFHLFAWPMFLAVPLGIARLWYSVDGTSNTIMTAVWFLLGCAVAALFFVGAALLFVWCTLGSRRPVLATLVAIVAVFPLMFIGVTGYIAFSMGENAIMLLRDIRTIVTLCFFALGGVIAFALTSVPAAIVFRRLGWRLATGIAPAEKA